MTKEDRTKAFLDAFRLNVKELDLKGLQEYYNELKTRTSKLMQACAQVVFEELEVRKQ